MSKLAYKIKSNIIIFFAVCIFTWTHPTVGKASNASDFLSELKEPSINTYILSEEIPNLRLRKIVVTPYDVQVFFEKSGGLKGNIWLAERRCIGFWECKRYEYYRYRFVTKNNEEDLQEIFNFTWKSSVIGEKEKKLTEKKQSKSSSRMKYIREAERELFRAKKGVATSEDWNFIKVSNVYSNSYALRFPYKGGKFSKFDLLEGYDGSWNFKNVYLPSYSEEEKEFHSATIKKINSNKNLFERSNREDLQNLVNRYKKHEPIARVLKNILSKKSYAENDELVLIEFANNNKDDKSIVEGTINKIRESLIKKRDVPLYIEIIESAESDIDGVSDIANDFTQVVWEDIIEPSGDIDLVINFIDEFSDASGDMIAKAFDVATSLDSAHLSDRYNAMLKKRPESDEFSIQERIARSMFIDAVQAKEADDIVSFAVKYYTVTNDSLLKETEAAFNLYRDKEMKDFFSKKFEYLVQRNRDFNDSLIETVVSLGEAINTIAENTNVAEVSKEETRKQNQEFLMQSYIFDKSFRSDGD